MPVAIVTGSDSGIGKATVKAMVLMVQRGLTVVIPSPMNAGGDFAVAYGGGGAITPP